MTQPQSSTRAKIEFSEEEQTDAEDEDIDELEDSKEAEFGPDAVRTMISKLSEEERYAMKGDVKEEPFSTKTEDMGPCGSAAVS